MPDRLPGVRSTRAFVTSDGSRSASATSTRSGTSTTRSTWPTWSRFARPTSATSWVSRCPDALTWVIASVHYEFLAPLSFGDVGRRRLADQPARSRQRRLRGRATARRDRGGARLGCTRQRRRRGPAARRRSRMPGERPRPRSRASTRTRRVSHPYNELGAHGVRARVQWRHVDVGVPVRLRRDDWRASDGRRRASGSPLLDTGTPSPSVR